MSNAGAVTAESSNADISAMCRSRPSVVVKRKRSASMRRQTRCCSIPETLGKGCDTRERGRPLTWRAAGVVDGSGWGTRRARTDPPMRRSGPSQLCARATDPIEVAQRLVTVSQQRPSSGDQP